MTYHHSKHDTCIVMVGTCMYNCPTFFLFWECLDDMSYWTNLYRTVADNELHFFTIFKLELYSFCEPCPYMYVCVDVYACVCAERAHVCTRVRTECARVRVHVCVCVCMCVLLWARVWILAGAGARAGTRVRVRMCACARVCA